MLKDTPIAVLTEAKHRIAFLATKSERVAGNNEFVREWIADSIQIVRDVALDSACARQLEKCRTELRDMLVGLPGIPDEFKRSAVNEVRVEVRDALKTLLHDIEEELSVRAKLEPVNDFWSDLHPDVVRVSRKLFEDGHYAESVFAALTELNNKVKNYLLSTGKVSSGKGDRERDGADMMFRAFGMPKDSTSPLVVLGDLTTESGRNIQNGYTQIFAGTMPGIRNPKAHDNL